MFTAALFIIVPNWEQPNNHQLMNRYPYNVIPLGNKKKQITDLHNKDESQQHYADTKDCKLDESIYMKLQKEQH